MDLLMIGVVAAVAVVGVTALAPRVGVAAPLLLVALGVLISLVPAVPAVEIEPEWILGVVLPPLLYATSVSMPTMDFRRDLTAISGLSVLLVVATSLALGVLFSWLIPDISLATGIALGAVISPTDAVATSIVRRSGVSPRVVTVLEGESLLNDASALVLLRSAIAATAASVTLWEVAGDFAFAVVVAVAIGAVVGKVSLLVRSRIADPHLTTAISFIVPFVAYIPAEHLDASGLVATVAAGLVSGAGSVRLRPQDRIAEAANWRTLELLLEGAVFLLMGLELYGLVVEVLDEHGSLWRAFWLGVLAAAVVLVVRTGYVAFLLTTLSRRARRGVTVRGYLSAINDRADALDGLGREELAQLHLPGRPPGARGDDSPEHRRVRLRTRITRRIADIDYLQAEPLGPREGAVLVWAGMRGVVTLAAAQSLPHDTPHRALLVLVAFTVAAGTLLVQGGTLAWLVRVLGLSRDGADDRADVDRLGSEMTRAAVELLERPDLRRPDGSAYDDVVLDRARRIAARQKLQVESDDDADRDRTSVEAQLRDLRMAMLDAQRTALLRVRDLGTASSGALTEALKVLDADQISLELRARDDA
ncbi:cation:proton antiporter [Cellulomonas hominis]|uniref:cation:proton antiporter n=1 Tax=Cellulomonas hominis TaxID=156981 RepID=UPI001B90B615|nr:sodium:proton antiporter [Cellulomonas hominis]VTR78250.1 Sodium, potassium, lithium and rubidium/H(+) antiporter [Cellulomonas hominis]